MGILNGAKVSVGKYIAMSLIPSFIGNGELRAVSKLTTVIGGCLREYKQRKGFGFGGYGQRLSNTGS